MFLELWSKGPGVFSVETLTIPQLFSSTPHFFPQVCFSLEPIGSFSQESKSSEGLGMRMDDSWLLRGGV